MKSKLSIHIFLLFFLFAGNFAVPAQRAFAQGLPEQAYVSGVVGYAQTYSLSCESRSAADLAGYFGVYVNEVDFFNNLPKSDNPNKGFVGNVHAAWGYTPPNGYGVHATPIARTLRQYGLEAKARYGFSWKQLRQEIAAGRPVIVWVIGGVWSGDAQTYTASDGEEVLVAPYEHTMLLIGYDENNVHLIDAGTGYTLTHPISNFRASWGVLGNMAVIVDQEVEKEEEKQDDKDDKGNDNKQNDAKNTSGSYTVKRGDYLSQIAREFNVSWQDLAAANNIYYPYIIYTGQKLTIPGQGNQQQADKDEKPAEDSKPQEDKSDKPVASGDTYTVKKGEHLMQIARDLKLEWRTIAELNGLAPPYTLYPGQKLNLPVGSATAAEPKPEKKDEPDPQPENKDIPNKYTVQRGEYLVQIARDFGLNWQTLASINNIGYPYVVHPGQVIRLK
ncbi:MAG: LysM peptidoglycan-binding domain-containing protein [Anaerolineales bacterium]|nr:LysM peptidoglycan-binding domain-containing protein [Anaerolineales bacterium]